jgi:hypothetical protein
MAEHSIKLLCTMWQCWWHCLQRREHIACGIRSALENHVASQRMHFCFSTQVLLQVSQPDPDPSYFAVFARFYNCTGSELFCRAVLALLCKPSFVCNRTEQRIYREMPAPKCFICPLTNKIFDDPVVCSDGHTYERYAIENRFRAGTTISPMTNERLDSDFLPNIALREAITEWRRTADSDYDVLTAAVHMKFSLKNSGKLNFPCTTHFCRLYPSVYKIVHPSWCHRIHA